MNFDFYLADVDVICEYINKSISDEDANALSYIRGRFINIMESIPYNWYFCKGLFYDNIDIDTKEFGGYIELNAILNNLVTLKRKLISVESYSTINIDCEFEDIQTIIISEIQKATTSVCAAVAWLSDYKICEALVKKYDENILVRVIMYDDGFNHNTSVFRSNIEKYIVPRGSGDKDIMHNKFCVFDNKITITGSYNWSKSAVDHYENIVVITNEKISQQFSQQFNKIVKKNIAYKV